MFACGESVESLLALVVDQLSMALRFAILCYHP
jgi:hypothetical protein